MFVVKGNYAVTQSEKQQPIYTLNSLYLFFPFICYNYVVPLEEISSLRNFLAELNIHIHFTIQFFYGSFTIFLVVIIIYLNDFNMSNNPCDCLFKCRTCKIKCIETEKPNSQFFINALDRKIHVRINVIKTKTNLPKTVAHTTEVI